MIPIDYLSAFPLLSGLNTITSQRFASVMVAKSYKPSEFVVKQGDLNNDLMFLLNGKLQVFDTQVSGKDVGLSIIEKGSFFGELAVIDGLPRSASIMAVMPSVVLIMPCSVARDFFFRDAEGSQRILVWMAGRLRADSLQHSAAFSSSAKNRVLSVLYKLSQPLPDGSMVINAMPTQKQIAVMANLARETVARVLAELRNESLLVQQGRERKVTLAANAIRNISVSAEAFYPVDSLR